MLRTLFEESSIIEVIATFVALAIIVAFVLSLAFILVGGIGFILSAGDEAKIKTSISTIRYSIIGLVIKFLATFIVSWISSLLDIALAVSFSMIMGIIGDIAYALSE